MSRISADELAYHRKLAARLREAQAIWQSWAVHLAEKYELGDGEQITEAGEIVRATTPAAPEAN